MKHIIENKKHYKLPRNKRNMTICIASLCENRENIIVASDKMVTVGEIIEFEHDVTKFEELTKNSLILTAGSATIQDDIIKDAKKEIKKLNNITFEDINMIIKSSYLNIRNMCSEEAHLKPIGLNWDTFYKNQKAFLSEFVFRIIDKVERNDLGVGFVLCGFGNDNKGNVQLIEDSGTSESFNSVGFCAVGTGHVNAISIFTLHNYAPSFRLEKALYLTYSAKKNAERAPVGCETDIVIISKEGIRKLTKPEMSILESIYQEHTKLDEKGYDDVKTKLVDIFKNAKE
jgi:20S proteasome alpha/beta subunit